jgi:hypothetical protein
MMNLRTQIFLLGILTIEAVLLAVYSSHPQRAFTSKPPLHDYHPLWFSSFLVLPRALKRLAAQFLGFRQRFGYTYS